jgi:DNA-binding response OmpR family regulator
MALEDASVECELVVFDDGRDALDHILTADAVIPPLRPDLMILDLNLPKNDGFEILEAVRATRAFEDVPIAVLSSSTSGRERAKLATFEVREFIAKPPDLEEYLKIGTVVRQLLGG